MDALVKKIFFEKTKFSHSSHIHRLKIKQKQALIHTKSPDVTSSKARQSYIEFSH